VRFEFGVIVIEDDYTVKERGSASIIGALRVRPNHAIDPAHLAYHRSRFDLS
jgi:hypothetical protein